MSRIRQGFGLDKQLNNLTLRRSLRTKKFIKVWNNKSVIWNQSKRKMIYIHGTLTQCSDSFRWKWLQPQAGYEENPRSPIAWHEEDRWRRCRRRRRKARNSGKIAELPEGERPKGIRVVSFADNHQCRPNSSVQDLRPHPIPQTECNPSDGQLLLSTCRLDGSKPTDSMPSQTWAQPAGTILETNWQHDIKLFIKHKCYTKKECVWLCCHALSA